MGVRTGGGEDLLSCDVFDIATGELLEKQLIGYLDAVVEHAGKLVVLEHKTAARAWSEHLRAYTFQNDSHFGGF